MSSNNQKLKRLNTASGSVEPTARREILKLDRGISDCGSRNGRDSDCGISACQHLSFSAFKVTTRFSLHAAIDRFTGQVIDKQIEVVKE